MAADKSGISFAVENIKKRLPCEPRLPRTISLQGGNSDNARTTKSVSMFNDELVINWTTIKEEEIKRCIERVKQREERDRRKLKEHAQLLSQREKESAQWHGTLELQVDLFPFRHESERTIDSVKGQKREKKKNNIDHRQIRTERPKKSQLNPYAKEFIPAAGPIVQKQSAELQFPTPTYYQTQSPFNTQQPSTHVPEQMLAGPAQVFMPQPSIRQQTQVQQATHRVQTTQGGPLLAHMFSTQPIHQPYLNHVPHKISNPQTLSNEQINSQLPTFSVPSPVHTRGLTPQQPLYHPISSGVSLPPQSYRHYPQATLQLNTALQPSYHNPQFHHYNEFHSHPMQMQVRPQFSMTPMSSLPTSAACSMQTKRYHPPHLHHLPQTVMMPSHHDLTEQVQHLNIDTPQFQGHRMPETSDAECSEHNL